HAVATRGASRASPASLADAAPRRLSLLGVDAAGRRCARTVRTRRCARRAQRSGLVPVAAGRVRRRAAARLRPAAVPVAAAPDGDECDKGKEDGECDTYVHRAFLRNLQRCGLRTRTRTVSSTEG